MDIEIAKKVVIFFPFITALLDFVITVGTNS